MTTTTLPSYTNNEQTTAAKRTIRVAIVEDFLLMRDAVEQIVHREGDMQLVGSWANGTAALKEIQESCPDILLLDLHLPDMGGLEMFDRVKKNCPRTRVVALAAGENQDLFLQAIGHGISGYLTKQADSHELVDALRRVHAGESVVSATFIPYLMHELATRQPDAQSESLMLCEQEREVLRMVADGRTDKEIGAKLYISPRTVQNHLAKIRKKTGTKRRSELARWAVENTWI